MSYQLNELRHSYCDLHVVNIMSTFLQINDTDPMNDTEQATGIACDLLDNYNLLNESGNFNNGNILHIFLQQNVLDACTHWVNANINILS